MPNMKKNKTKLFRIWFFKQVGNVITIAYVVHNDVSEEAAKSWVATLPGYTELHQISEA